MVDIDDVEEVKRVVQEIIDGPKVRILHFVINVIKRPDHERYCLRNGLNLLSKICVMFNSFRLISLKFGNVETVVYTNRLCS